MNDFKFTSRVKKTAGIIGILFIMYNLLVFVAFGFKGHSASFWLSYIFMLIAFGVTSLTAASLKNRNLQPKDWLLGYPVLRHSAIYIVAELIVSFVFIAIDSITPPWWIAFIIQTLLLGIHLVLIISCFIAQETIVETGIKVKDATSFIQLLKVDIEMIAEKSSDPNVKTEFMKFAEDVRFSDPISNENLFELEKEIVFEVNKADSFISVGDSQGALACCQKAKLLLVERNKKTAALK